MSLPKVIPSFLSAISFTIYCPVEENLCVIVIEVLVVSEVLSPKFQEKYEALSEQEALNVTVVLVVAAVGEYVKHASVGLEQEIAKQVMHVINVKN